MQWFCRRMSHHNSPAPANARKSVSRTFLASPFRFWLSPWAPQLVFHLFVRSPAARFSLFALALSSPAGFKFLCWLPCGSIFAFCSRLELPSWFFIYLLAPLRLSFRFWFSPWAPRLVLDLFLGSPAAPLRLPCGSLFAFSSRVGLPSWF